MSRGRNFRMGKNLEEKGCSVWGVKKNKANPMEQKIAGQGNSRRGKFHPCEEGVRYLKPGRITGSGWTKKGNGKSKWDCN